MKDIKNYEGLYGITKEGKVWTFARPKVRPGWKKPVFNSNLGYYQIDLYKNSVRKKFYIHRLVAEAYVKNKYNKKFVNHKDSDRINNNFKNLEWCTKKENTQHAISKGRIKFNPVNGRILSYGD